VYTVANIIVVVEKITTLYCVATLGGVAGKYMWPESIWPSLATVADSPVADLPGTDLPGTDLPGTDLPGTDSPGTDSPGTDSPVEIPLIAHWVVSTRVDS
jgi:hypothetical protein